MPEAARETIREIMFSRKMKRSSVPGNDRVGWDFNRAWLLTCSGGIQLGLDPRSILSFKGWLYSIFALIGKKESKHGDGPKRLPCANLLELLRRLRRWRPWPLWWWWWECFWKRRWFRIRYHCSRPRATPWRWQVAAMVGQSSGHERRFSLLLMVELLEVEGDQQWPPS